MNSVSQVPDAKDALPVGLAVSLLQDRQGQIDLNIPVSGSLDDPEFSVGGIIVKVIVNLISKAVTAPFALIGSMFGGEDMDLNNLQFASGSARLDEKTIKALNIVAKAMQDRPGIKIQIIGMASEKEDGEGLKEQLLMRDMRYAIYRDTTSATNAKVLTAAQIDKAIKQLYSESTAPNKPKNTDIEQMKAFLMKNQRVATADLKQLADRRAAAVGLLDSERKSCCRSTVYFDIRDSARRSSCARRCLGSARLILTGRTVFNKITNPRGATWFRQGP